MQPNFPMEPLLNWLRSRVPSEVGELVYRVLSFDDKTNTCSSVLIAKATGRDKGYVWIEIGSDTICCHSTAVATGPMSSWERRLYKRSDPDFELQLRSTILAIFDA